MSNEFDTIGLYEHNIKSYKKVKNAFDNGNDIVGIVHATGTGKTYNALQLLYDNQDKKTLYIVPSNAIIEHIKEIIEKNTKLDLKNNFSQVEFRTYQSFINMSKDELSKLNVDMLILDEFHHIGAPVWGDRVNYIIKTHTNIKIFGMTAYTVRDRETIYERDMANPETNEIFSNKIVSRYDICDAMIDGVLPKPIYKSAYVKLEDTAIKLNERLEKLNHNSKEYIECKKILHDIRKKVHEAPSISDVVKRNIKTNGKYIYFCPPINENGVNDIETIMEEAKKWFLEIGLTEEEIVFYKTTGNMGKHGKKNRDAFYNDKDLNGSSSESKLRVMFAINQYNEGVHAPNLDGVIMGRETTSDIVFFEQLGRALSARGETKKKFNDLEQYSIEELIRFAKEREIKLNPNISKVEIIEKLLSPVIIDLSNNLDFIKNLENNLQDRIKEIQKSNSYNKRIIKLTEASFDIEMGNQDLFEILKYVRDRLTNSWIENYELAKKYYEVHNNLLIPKKFKTINGHEFDENGINLNKWLERQRVNYEKLSSERQQMLLSIGFIKDPFELQWNNNYKLAQKYYIHHRNLLVPHIFKTTNGYEFDKNGVNLGFWISTQRKKIKTLSEQKLLLLKNIGFVEDISEKEWQEKYMLAKQYYEHYKNLLIPGKFKTVNGIEFDENGVLLGAWISRQRINFELLTKEKQQKLLSIGFVKDVLESRWIEKYELAKQYYEHFNNLLIPRTYKTINGYEYDENGDNLGSWINNQKIRFEKLSKEKQQMLLDLGLFTNVKNNYIKSK